MFLFSPIRWALRLPSMAIFGAIVYVVASGVQVVAASRQSVAPASLKKVAAIVVLPAPLVGGTLSADLTGRLQEALRLDRAGVAPKIVVAGAPARPGAPSPAKVAQTWLVARGVRAGSITELASPTTTATLAALPAVLGASAHIVAVTDAMDALFTRGAAASDGIEAVVEPAVGSSSLSTSELGPLWRQATGVAAGRVIGYSHVSWVSE